MSAPVPLNSGCCAPVCPSSPQAAVPGPAGENAFSLTTLQFTQPASGANVVLTLNHDGWVVPGQTIFVQGGGYYLVVSVSGLSVTVTNTGNTGNAAPGTVIAAASEVSPGGIGGNIGNAYTTTTAAYVQPAVGANVNVAVVTSAWAAVGEPIFIATGGSYTVFAIPDGLHITVTNLGYPANAAPATNIVNPQQVTPSGVRGATGPSGASTLNGLSPTTTKGDIIVDNGANSPLASDVRLGVGTNGKALVADSTQATGLNYATITPNVAATIGDIPIFSSTAGTPIALSDSKLLITADGAIQSTPSGGNPRGSKAVDLQVTRTGAGQVASGANSGVLSGESNTASGTDSVVAGGNGNSASALHAAVAAGFTNIASAANAFVGGGNGNTASAPDSTVGAGANNTASGAGGSVVAGGDNNISSGTDSFVGGGNGNHATAQESSVVGGNSNIASARVSTVLTGISALAYLWGQVSSGNGIFAAAGDAQSSELQWRISTTDATANVEAFLDGVAARAVIPLNNSWAFDIIAIGRSGAGVGAVWRVTGGIQNVAATVSLIAAVTTTVLADGTGATWGVAGNFVVSADNVNKSLKIAVTGAALTNIRWVIHAKLVEVNF